jgi:hypothetical protein
MKNRATENPLPGCRLSVVRFSFRRRGGDATAAGLFLVEHLIGARWKECFEFVDCSAFGQRVVADVRGSGQKMGGRGCGEELKHHSQQTANRDIVRRPGQGDDSAEDDEDDT